MHKFILSAVEKFPSFKLKRWFDSTNIPWIKRHRAENGPMTVVYVQEVAHDPEIDVVGYCPLCAHAIKVSKGPDGDQASVMLYRQDKTALDPEVKIAKRHALHVECFGEKYQVGCMDPNCVRSSPKDRFGILDSAGRILRFSIPFEEHFC